MSCHDIEPLIIDFARGATSDRVREDALNRHLLGCPSCTGLIERERAMSAALRRLAESIDGPPPNPAQEEALLAIFDQTRAGSPTHAHAPLWMGAIAATVVLGTVATLFVRLPSRIPNAVDSSAPPAAAVPVAGGSPSSSPAVAASGNERPTRTLPAPRVAEEPGDLAATTDFLLWPGAAAWPPFESGELVRVTLPLDALPALGVAPPAAADAVVQADVLVGQDGFARAIRLVQ
jgi:hypothetical protein